ncbi:MAG: hypothetical protein JO035_14690 [Betaproteobacteria bacterium]|nr:hypothetical protein [Betaproteobacteria bacterium]
MKPDVMDQLREARDFYSLTKTVLALCEPYGPVHAFRLVHNRGASRVACFVELEATKQQPLLARALGCRMVNGAVWLEVPVGRDFPQAGEFAPLPERVDHAELGRIAAPSLNG